MASQQIKAQRRAVAVRRLLEAQGRIGVLLGLEVPVVRVTNRDGELAQIQETEAVAGFLEALEAKLSAGPSVDAEEEPVAQFVDQPVAQRARRTIVRKGAA